MTPREYRALIDRRADAERLSDARFGQLMALVASLGGAKNGSRQYTAVDFFPSLARRVVSTSRAVARQDAPDAVVSGWAAWAALCHVEPPRALTSGQG